MNTHFFHIFCNKSLERTHIDFLPFGEGFGGLPTVLNLKPLFEDDDVFSSCPVKCKTSIETLAT